MFRKEVGFNFRLRLPRKISRANLFCQFPVYLSLKEMSEISCGDELFYCCCSDCISNPKVFNSTFCGLCYIFKAGTCDKKKSYWGQRQDYRYFFTSSNWRQQIQNSFSEQNLLWASPPALPSHLMSVSRSLLAASGGAVNSQFPSSGLPRTLWRALLLSVPQMSAAPKAIGLGSSCWHCLSLQPVLWQNIGFLGWKWQWKCPGFLLGWQHCGSQPCRGELCPGAGAAALLPMGQCPMWAPWGSSSAHPAPAPAPPLLPESSFNHT